jgi:hypothetical protein
MVTLKGLHASLMVLIVSGCTFTEDYRAFRKSHDSIQPQMTFSEVFVQSLADYLILLKTKNITGQTLSENQPVSKDCERYVLDIRYSHVTPNPGAFHVFIFCNSNLPTSIQMVPKQSYVNKNDFLKALITTYSSWSKSMQFRVESPPKFIGGVYDNYEFTIDQYGRVSSVSPIVSQ